MNFHFLFLAVIARVAFAAIAQDINDRVWAKLPYTVDVTVLELEINQAVEELTKELKIAECVKELFDQEMQGDLRATCINYITDIE
ncbi:uncharacterized protein CELE_F36D1.14 [Caenorhabditis elegans]|uniref:Secreted protein n=1 Tax=Caenorhabditis elegans TaxID=6239 RepID=G5EGE6_CAEEL|nr:Secreted protein [Caenorhabditis elegans]NP_001251602.1 Secreted protein [Caenorhabditis elegans]CBW44378.1 Secreted protein [Caenorhabditis elegans]CBW44379.1 Secreted protein [Caenorhabditis elegans]|eukprot:NP_001251601.1 Uncharacterized protein CELE_F36D1.13 [Caenorhabditis elegans]